MRALAVFLVAGTLALTGCSAPIEGVVIGKDYDPPYSRNYTENERYACGTESYQSSSWSGTSKRTVTRSRTKYCNRQVTKTRRESAHWDLIVRTDAGEEKHASVSQSAYNRVRVGERINTKDLR